MTRFNDFDVIEIPEVISVENNFDILNTALDHPSRKKTDTYYVNDGHVLRTHTTAMWSFYLRHSKAIEKIQKDEDLKCPMLRKSL